MATSWSEELLGVCATLRLLRVLGIRDVALHADDGAIVGSGELRGHIHDVRLQRNQRYVRTAVDKSRGDAKPDAATAAGYDYVFAGKFEIHAIHVAAGTANCEYRKRVGAGYSSLFAASRSRLSKTLASSSACELTPSFS